MSFRPRRPALLAALAAGVASPPALAADEVVLAEAA